MNASLSTSVIKRGRSMEPDPGDTSWVEAEKLLARDHQLSLYSVMVARGSYNPVLRQISG